MSAAPPPNPPASGAPAAHASPDAPVGRIVLTPSKAAGKPQITITVLAGPEQGLVHKITRPTTTMGRSNTCEIVLTDPQVSRQHCQLILGMGGVTLRDLGSTNGTFLNGARISESSIRNQDVISIGATRLRFAVEVMREAGDHRSPKMDELAHKKLLTLYEVGNIVNSVLELKTLLNIIMSMAIKVMQANRGFLLLGDGTGKMKPVSTHALTQAEAQAPYSQTIVDTVLKERVPVLVLDAVHDVRFSNRESLQALPLSSIICVPIWERENIVGVIYVDKAEGTSTFTEEDMYFLSAFANQSAVAITNAKLFEDVRREERMRTSLQRFLSPNVVEDWVHKSDAMKLGGEKKRVTVLFSDIRGFTSMVEKQPVEKIVTLLNEYFSAMSEVIFDHQGTLDKFIGDAIMAIYGAPLDQPDHALACVKTALGMKARLEQLNERWKAQGLPRLDVGYAINTGEAIVGNIGSERRMEYTAIGDTVNTTARVEGETKANQILITAATFKEIEGKIETGKPFSISAKGKSEKVEVYEVKGLKPEK